MGAMNMLF